MVVVLAGKSGQQPLFIVFAQDVARQDLILLGSNELVALAVDVDNLDRGILFEVLAQLSDIHIH